jgi:ABC-type Fe3+ transport system permease subunit
MGALFETTDVFETYVYRTLSTSQHGMSAAADLYKGVIGFVLVLITRPYRTSDRSREEPAQGEFHANQRNQTLSRRTRVRIALSHYAMHALFILIAIASCTLCSS